MRRLIVLAFVLAIFACQAHARRHLLPWRNKAEGPTSVEYSYTLQPIDAKRTLPAPSVANGGCSGASVQSGCGGEGRRGLFRGRR